MNNYDCRNTIINQPNNFAVEFSNQKLLLVQSGSYLNTSFYYQEIEKYQYVVLQCDYEISDWAFNILLFLLRDELSTKIIKKIIEETQTYHKVTYKLNQETKKCCDLIPFDTMKECFRILDSIDIKALLVALIHYFSNNDVNMKQFMKEIMENRIPKATLLN